jgi:hypothetical protein
MLKLPSFLPANDRPVVGSLKLPFHFFLVPLNENETWPLGALIVPFSVRLVGLAVVLA